MSEILRMLICGSSDENSELSVNGCGMDNVIRAFNLVAKGKDEVYSIEHTSIALEYGTIKGLVTIHGISAVSNMIDSIGEQLGTRYGKKPEAGHTYTVLRIIFTMVNDLSAIKFNMTFVPWSSKDGKRTYLKAKNFEDEIIASMIKIAVSMTKDKKCESSIMDTYNLTTVDEVGQYFNHNWHKYSSIAQTYGSNIEVDSQHGISTAMYTLYRVEL